MFSKFA